MHLKQWRPFQKTSRAPLLPDVPKHSVANGQYLSKFSVRPTHHSPKHQRNRKNKHWTVLGARSTGPTMPETSVGGSSKSRFSHAQRSRRPTHEPLRVQGSSDASKEPQSGPATGFRDLWHCKCRGQEHLDRRMARKMWTCQNAKRWAPLQDESRGPEPVFACVRLAMRGLSVQEPAAK